MKSLKPSLAAGDEKSANTPGDVFVEGAAVAVTGESKRSDTRSLDWFLVEKIRNGMRNLAQ